MNWDSHLPGPTARREGKKEDGGEDDGMKDATREEQRRQQPKGFNEGKVSLRIVF